MESKDEFNKFTPQKKLSNMGIVISEVRIKNFRSLKDVTVKLSPNITLLVGANNAGKSTFLRALNIALNLDRKFIGLDDLFINKDGEQLPKGERIIRIDIKIVPETGSSVFAEKWIQEFSITFKDRYNNGCETFAFRTKIDFSENIHSAKIQRFIIRAWDSNPVSESDSDILQGKLENMPFYLIDAQRDLYNETTQKTSDFGRIANKVEYPDEIRGELERQLKKLNEDAVKDSPVLNNLKTNLEKLNNTVQSNGGGVQITPFPKKIRDLSKGMKVHFQDGESDSFGLEYHGMGTRSWASLLTFKAMIEQETLEREEENSPFHPSLGLEEPEAHLHPNAQRQVYSQLSEIKGQKIISTHSPYIVAQAELSELRHFYKTTDSSEISSIDFNELKPNEVKQITLDISSSKGETLFSKAIILCEGETEERSLPIFAEAYWNQSLYELGVSIVCTGKFYPLLHLLKFLKIEWFIFADYDKPDVKTKLKSVLKRAGFTGEFPSNVVCLNNETTQFDFEEYLYDLGYDAELRSALKKLKEPEYANEQHKKSKEAEVKIENNRIEALDKTKFIKELDDWKAKAAPIYSELILERTETSERFPEKIKLLFEVVSERLNLKKQTI